MKCKEHPRYTAARQPTKTRKHPNGCPACRDLWEAKRRRKS